MMTLDTTLERVLARLAAFAIFPGIPLVILAHLAVRRRKARRERAAFVARTEAAIAKITADGKIEKPKGRYRPRHWAGRWVAYINGLKMPRSNQAMSAPDLPPYPNIKK